MGDILSELKKRGAETEDALERFMDDKEMYLNYVFGFPKEKTMGTLMQAVESHDYVQAGKSVHALKGIVNNLGFIPLADATEDMLAELRDNNIEDALEAFEDVEKQYRLFCEAIEEFTESESKNM